MFGGMQQGGQGGSLFGVPREYLNQPTPQEQQAAEQERLAAERMANPIVNRPAVPIQSPNRTPYQPQQLPTQGGGGIRPVQPVQVNNAALQRLFSPQVQSAPTAGMTEVSKALRAGATPSAGE